MRALKKSLKILLIIFCIVIAGLVALFVYFTLTDFQPVPSEHIAVMNNSPDAVIDSGDITFITWNVGYCGLDESMDFFYDGGKMVRPDKATFQNNLNGVFDFLSKNDSMDFFLLQEVDTASKRSYYMNQAALFSKALPDYTFSFAVNYNVKHVPAPMLKPLGKVVSGISTFSRYYPLSSERFSYPVNYSWPLKIFMLDRCFMIQRFLLSNHKELIVINTHNSAFDDADRLRQYEMWMLRGFILNEYAKGNFVIAGGDWNQNPYNYNSFRFASDYVKKSGLPKIPFNFMPDGWQWACDSTCPTNRDLRSAYKHGSTPTTIYDFFVVSPNIIVETIKTLDCGFEFSDHQPVYLRIRLNDDPLAGCSKKTLDYIYSLNDSIVFYKEQNKRKK